MQWLNEGRAEEDRDNPQAALTAYEQALKGAQAREDAIVVAEAASGAAHALQDLLIRPQAGAQADQAGRKRMEDQVVAYFRTAIQWGRGLEKQRARSDLGVFFIRIGRYQEAAAELNKVVDDIHSVNRDLLNDRQKAIVLFNRGDARERKTRNASLQTAPLAPIERSLALEDFLESSRLDPQFEAASERAFTLLLERNDTRAIEQASGLALSQLAAGRGDHVMREVGECLQKWTRRDESPVLLKVFVKHYASTPVDPGRFEDDDAAWRTLRRFEQEPVLGPPVREIRKAFTGAFDPTLDPREAQALFPAWSSPRLADGSFPAFLIRVAETYNTPPSGLGLPRDPGKALARFTVAWALDLNNLSAAEGAARILNEFPRRFDPRLGLYEQFNVQLLGIDRGTGSRRETAEDWGRLEQIHFLLGGIFEDRPAQPRNSPRNPLYHWERAREAERKARSLDPTHPPFRQLHQSIARLNAKDKSRAIRLKALYEFRDLALEFHGLGLIGPTAEAVITVDHLKWSLRLDAAARKRLDEDLADIRASLGLRDEPPVEEPVPAAPAPAPVPFPVPALVCPYCLPVQAVEIGRPIRSPAGCWHCRRIRR